MSHPGSQFIIRCPATRSAVGHFRCSNIRQDPTPHIG
jgi:hypothetical protein